MSSPKERPILFSGPMIRAILAGAKTQTRRVVKPQPDEDGLAKLIDGPWHDTDARSYRCPYGVPGDRLWGRETWRKYDRFKECACYEECHCPPSGTVLYRADGDSGEEKWRPSIFMPRSASRILLEINEVRLERLQDISEADARAEGITDGGCLNCGNSEPCGCPDPLPDARDSFCWLWQSINGPGSWAANPWVWVVSFRRVGGEVQA